MQSQGSYLIFSIFVLQTSHYMTLSLQGLRQNGNKPGTNPQKHHKKEHKRVPVPIVKRVLIFYYLSHISQKAHGIGLYL